MLLGKPVQYQVTGSNAYTDLRRLGAWAPGRLKVLYLVLLLYRLHNFTTGALQEYCIPPLTLSPRHFELFIFDKDSPRPEGCSEPVHRPLRQFHLQTLRRMT